MWFCDAVVEASSYRAGSLNLHPHPQSPVQAAEEALEADSRRFAQHLQEDAAATKAALAAVAEASIQPKLVRVDRVREIYERRRRLVLPFWQYIHRGHVLEE